jgi:hypothetical protein
MDEDLKARLLKPRVTEGTVEIAGVGEVRVRGLSRGEVFAARKTTNEKDVGALERRYLSLGMVEPRMTEADVLQWQQGSPAGEIEPVVDKVMELSGLGKGAEKSGVPGAGDESGDGVRALPGSEAVDDGGPAAGADEQ